MSIIKVEGSKIVEVFRLLPTFQLYGSTSIPHSKRSLFLHNFCFFRHKRSQKPTLFALPTLWTSTCSVILRDSLARSLAHSNTLFRLVDCMNTAAWLSFLPFQVNHGEYPVHFPTCDLSVLISCARSMRTVRVEQNRGNEATPSGGAATAPSSETKAPTGTASCCGADSVWSLEAF